MSVRENCCHEMHQLIREISLFICSGTNDYFGLNQYTSRIVYPDPGEELGIYTIDSGLIETVDPNWPQQVADGFYVTTLY